jgi:hypothetical protein
MMNGSEDENDNFVTRFSSRAKKVRSFWSKYSKKPQESQSPDCIIQHYPITKNTEHLYGFE